MLDEASWQMITAGQCYVFCFFCLEMLGNSVCVRFIRTAEILKEKTKTTVKSLSLLPLSPCTTLKPPQCSPDSTERSH